jgi:hypothetical protein
MPRRARNVQRTYAPPADRISRNIEVSSKPQRFGTIHYLLQGQMVNIPERRMEKAGADLARCFDHRGDPGRVTGRCDGLRLTDVGAEVEDNSAQFAG